MALEIRLQEEPCAVCGAPLPRVREVPSFNALCCGRACAETLQRRLAERLRAGEEVMA